MTRGKKGSSGIDWSNIEERRKARRDYQKAYTIKYPERVKESMRLYRMKHPKPHHEFHICRCGNLVEEVPHLRHKNMCNKCYRLQSRLYSKTIPSTEKRARAIISRMLVAGRINPEPCQICNKKAQAHHPDYSKPFQVAWLCVSHHQKLHYGYRYALKVVDYQHF
jgi:hypothetical protein